LELFKTIAERAPRHIVDQTLPLLFASLPEDSPSREAIASREKCWRILSTLRRLCIQQALFEVMVVRLMAKFDYLCFSSRVQGDDLELAQAYSYMILKTLVEALKTKMKGKDADVVKYIDNLVPRLLNVFAVSASWSEDRVIVASDPRLFKVAGDIITLVVQSLPVSSVS
jgi:DNA repair/transcription protein MET18/MMS19